MPALQEQHEKWAAAHMRLRDGTVPVPRVPRSRPVSPFARARAELQQRLSRLFPRPIVELNSAGEPVPSSNCPPWKVIAIEVARKHGVSLTDLVSPRRDRPTVAARHEAFYRCRFETSMSLPAIGMKFGGRDHTTVIHGVKKHGARLRESGNG